MANRKNADFFVSIHANANPVRRVKGIETYLLNWANNEESMRVAARGAPCEVIKSDLTGLPLPATAELILEGEIETVPSKFQEEGPFGEYTGYYYGKTGEEWPKPVFHVKRILHRKNLTFWCTSVGKPVTDTHMIQSLNRTATLWTDLETMKVPGVQSVYIPPEMGGRFWELFL